ncbi:hypothetical protein ABT010_34780 [Streptomyces sp. NPDC002668]|uniref:hypothetical protein n=1 Tax=Streptomyces sp. NPDC002668 TaxID=3154422 RepID=UPI003319D8AD
MVVTAVPEYDVRAAARSAALAAYGRYRLKQWDEAIVGSGAATAKYDVVLTTFDKKNDSFAPHIRRKSLNKDGSITNYPWRKGAQGQNVLQRWDTPRSSSPRA